VIRRPRATRATLAATLTAVALSATALAAPPTAGETATDPGFAPQLVRVQTPIRADKEHLQALGLDLTEHAGLRFVDVVLHTAADRTTLVDSGLAFRVQISDLVRYEAERNAVDAEYAASVARSPLPSGRTAYRTLADYEADMAALVKSKPNLVKEFTLKRPSLDGRQVHALEIGTDVRRPASGRPTFVLMGLHHAREWPSGELAMEFAIDLVKHYGRSPRITRLLQKARVIVVPVVNPDGFDLSRTDGGLIDLNALDGTDPLGGTTSVAATPGNAYKRKNCRLVDGQDTPDGSCRGAATSPLGDGAGVDINRNYGGFWGGPGAAGPEPDPASTGAGVLDATYRGAAPFREPETRNIRDLLASRQVTLEISLHTFAALVLRPNGVNPLTVGPDGVPVGDPPDEAGLKALGAKFAAQTGYQNTHGWQLYDTTGTTEDWFYNATGGYGYTIEIGTSSFHPTYPEVVDEYLGCVDDADTVCNPLAGKGNREAFLIALESVVGATTSGILTGHAPAGAVLTLRKSFRTPTWGGSIADSVTSSITVPASGMFRWVVNPSTRPAVRSHPYQLMNATPFKSYSFTGRALPNESQDHVFTTTRYADNMHVDLDWPTPDDLDLEVYRRNANGSLTKVGGSGSAPGSKESTDIANAPAGTYVVRVVNFASVSPTYTLTVGLHDAVTKWTVGKREAYTLTCAVQGTVRQTTKVYVDRGQLRSLDLTACRR
jgi:hypothetical protein